MTPEPGARALSDLTTDDWQLLREFPLQAGAAVALADRTGAVALVRELVALSRAVFDAGPITFAGSALVQATVRALQGETELARAQGDRSNQEALPGWAETHDRRPPAETRAAVLADAGRIAALLRAKMPHEASAYTAWVMLVLDRVANAAKSGSFLGLGGQWVSSEEATLIAEIGRRLGAAPTTSAAGAVPPAEP